MKQLPPPLPHPLSQLLQLLQLSYELHPQSATGAHPQLSKAGAHAGAAHDGAHESQPIGAAQEGAAIPHPPQAEEPQVPHAETGAAQEGAHPPHADEPHELHDAIGAAHGAAQEGAITSQPQTSAGAAHVGAQPLPPHPKSPASALLAKQQTASAAAIEKNFILVSWVCFEREVVFRKLFEPDVHQKRGNTGELFGNGKENPLKKTRKIREKGEMRPSARIMQD